MSTFDSRMAARRQEILAWAASTAGEDGPPTWEVALARWRSAWLAENAEAIREYNERVEAHGLFNDGLRRF